MRQNNTHGCKHERRLESLLLDLGLGSSNGFLEELAEEATYMSAEHPYRRRTAELGSAKPQPSLPFWNWAPTAEQMPMPLPLISAQQVLRQSASATQPPVVNCWALPLPTSLAPELLGARAMTETATVGQYAEESMERSRVSREGKNSQARAVAKVMRTILTVWSEGLNEAVKYKRIVDTRPICCHRQEEVKKRR